MKLINGAEGLMKIIMRTSLIFSILSALFLNLVHASVSGQSALDKPINIQVRNIPFTNFLKAIE